jgi:hypothetical protein
VTASLRERIEAKARRTAFLPVLVSDVNAAAAEVATFRAALDVHLRMVNDRREAGAEPSEAEKEREANLRGQLAAALARQEQAVAQVELQSLAPDVWDEILSGIDDGPEGPDLGEVRAALVAASCVDEDLRDEAWWAEQFAGPQWSKGDLLAVNELLLRLNVYTPAGVAGKG